MTRTGLCALLVAAVTLFAWSGCSDDTTNGNDNNNNVEPGCGNGIVEPDIDEDCDDGENNSDTEPDACRTNCLFPTCGDNVRDTGEDCDGNDLVGAICSDLPPLNHGTLACTLDCEFDTDECYQCGDGTIDPGEECDTDALGEIDSEPANCGNVTGKPDGALACLGDCTYDLADCALCGDGIIEGPEECDDASDNSDQPNATCRLNCTTPICGDGIQDDNSPPRFEQCDCGTDPLALPLGCNTININNVPNACDASCIEPACGDGKVDNASPWNEVCDEGAGNCDEDGCTCATNCTLPGCGNGIIEDGEICDCGEDPFNLPGDCNNVNTDLTLDASCNEGCKPPSCGNQYIDIAEECDDGTPLNCNDGSCGCMDNCQLPGCDNLIIEPHLGEECDLGQSNCDDQNCLCNLDCLIPRCGNGYEDFGEQCDCGDNAQQQSCTLQNCDDDALCECAPGCLDPGCGNGVVEPYRGEGCDEGASNNCDTPGCTCTTGCAVPWDVEIQPSGAQFALNDVWTDGTEAWAVGVSGTVLHRDSNGTWTNATLPATVTASLHGIYADSANFVAVVGANNTLLFYDGVTWQDSSSYIDALGSVYDLTAISCWDLSMFDCAVTASNGTIIFTAISATVAYTNLPPYNTTTYNDLTVLIDSFSRPYLEALGDWGTMIYAYPFGTGWTPTHQGLTPENLNAIWRDTVSHGWLVGDAGTIYFSGGGTWTAQTSNTSENLLDVVGIANIAYAVGDNGVIRRYPGSGSHWVSESALQPERLQAVAAAGGLVLAVGEDGIVISRP